MRKVTKEYEVYKFNELEKDVQEEVLKRYKESEYDFYIDNDLYDDMVDLAQNTLENYFKGAKYNNIYYDLSYSQGSGAMVEFNIDLKDLNNKYLGIYVKNGKREAIPNGQAVDQYILQKIISHDDTD